MVMIFYSRLTICKRAQNSGAGKLTSQNIYSCNNCGEVDYLAIIKISTALKTIEQI